MDARRDERRLFSAFLFFLESFKMQMALPQPLWEFDPSHSAPALPVFCILILDSCGGFLQLRHIYEYFNFAEAQDQVLI